MLLVQANDTTRPLMGVYKQMRCQLIQSTIRSRFRKTIINMSRGCINSPDIFCYVCGQFTPSDSRSNITPLLKRCYFAYFGCKLGDQDKPFVPHKACKSCTSKLQIWSVGKLKCMPFGVPMVWWEQMNHHDDCYFCMTKVALYTQIFLQQ
ncbi:uncharacterized protein [Cherax quadricarinatus]|uniref:uncharacterized protein n=1 Tax=Cherax quadricarinatus TaxID=27406 RepID=UPI00387EA685